MTREQQIEYLLRLNKQHSAFFSGPDAQMARKQYRAKHPTEISAFKCMDGRIHIPLATKTPLGIIQPWRNLGGRFDLGWPYFARDVANWIEYAVRRGRDCLILVTYHFSRGDQHRGCAGFGYDKGESLRATLALKRQVERVFGDKHQVVYPILFGFETDEDAAILHGENGEILDLSTVTDTSEESMLKALQYLYPDMKERVLLDLLPLVMGNLSHIREIRVSQRPLTEVVHREWMIGVGRGFDWLHEPNMALLVGPFSPNLDEPIEKAAGIVKSNMEAGRIGDESFVLLTSAFYRKATGPEPRLAREKALFLRDFSVETIRTKFPDFAELMHPLPVVVNMEDRRMHIIGE